MIWILLILCCPKFFYFFLPLRLWHEKPGVFTPSQRAALRSASMSRIICDNTGITSVPMDAYRIVSNSNRLVQCSSIPRLNLAAWRDRPAESGQVCWCYVVIFLFLGFNPRVWGFVLQVKETWKTVKERSVLGNTYILQKHVKYLKVSVFHSTIILASNCFFRRWM